MDVNCHSSLEPSCNDRVFTQSKNLNILEKVAVSDDTSPSTRWFNALATETLSTYTD